MARLAVQGRSYRRGIISYEVRLSRTDTSSSSRLTLLAPYDTIVTAGDRLQLFAGYRGEALWLVWTGYATRVEADGVRLQVTARDGRYRLDGAERAKSQTWRRTRVEPLVRSVLEGAGITVPDLEFVNAERARRFVARKGQDDLEVLRSIKRTFRVEAPFWFDHQDVFHWRARTPGRVYRARYGHEIVTFEVGDGQPSRLELVQQPWIRLGDVISIEHPRHTGELVVEEIVHRGGDATRTDLYLEAA